MPVCHVCSVVSDSFATVWTVAHQTPLSMGFLRQKYWSELSFPSAGDLPGPETEPESPAWQADPLVLDPSGKPQFSLHSLPNECPLTLLLPSLGIILTHLLQTSFVPLSYKRNFPQAPSPLQPSLPPRHRLSRLLSSLDVGPAPWLCRDLIT